MSTAPVATPEGQPETGAVGRMTGVIVSPKQTFAEIARRPTWVAPFVILCVLSIVVSGLLAQKTDWRGFFERQNSKNSRFDQMPQDQKDRIVESQVKYAPQLAYVFGLVGTIIFVMVVTLVYWGAFYLFNGGGFGFKTAFGIVSHAYVPLIVSSVLSIIILTVKARGDVDPEHFLASNLAAFLPDPSEMAGSAGTIVGIILDLDASLVAIGFSAASPKKIKLGGAFLTVFGIWAVWVCGKVAWALF